jgi:protein DGCR14
MNNKISTKQQRLVLTKEEFTDTLSSIITRDYFPSLPSLHRDVAILQKRSEGDVNIDGPSVLQIQRAARILSTHEELQTQSEEMEEMIASRNGGRRNISRPLDRENIDGFHQRVTTEDNTKFELNMKREVKEKKHFMDLMYDTNNNGSDRHQGGQILPAGRKLDGTARMQLCDTPIMASGDFDAPVERIQVAGTTIEGKNKTHHNALFFTPQQMLETSDCKIHSSCPSFPSAQLSFGDSDGKMMPPPSRNNDKSELHTMQTSISTSTSTIRTHNNIMMMHLVENKAKSSSMCNLVEKQIVPSNTRFRYQSESSIVAPASHRSIESEPAPAALQTLEYDTDSSAVTDLDASPISIRVERKRRLHQIQKERNTFVAMTPSIVPGRERDDDDSSIMTWGDAAATPLVVRVEESDDVSNQSFPSFGRNDVDYRLPLDAREALAKEAEDKLAKRSRWFKRRGALDEIGHEARTKTAQGSKRKLISSTTLDRTLSLTPAARALLARSTPMIITSSRVSAKASMPVAARSGSAFGSALRNSYTPQPQSGKTRYQRARASRSINNGHRATPLASAISFYKNNNENKKRRDPVVTGEVKVSTRHVPHKNNASTSDLLEML